MNNFRTYRINKNLTQQKFAQLMSVSQQSIAAWESGKRTPRTEMLPKIASLLDCSIDELLRGTGKAEHADGS